MKSAKRQNKITPNQLRAMQALWPQVAPMLAKDREARIAYAAGIIDREISSYNDLTADEAARVIDEMQRSTLTKSDPHNRRSNEAAGSSVVTFPANKPANASLIHGTQTDKANVQHTDDTAASETFAKSGQRSAVSDQPKPETRNQKLETPIRHVATDRQRWMIKKLSNYLNWDDDLREIEQIVRDFLTKN